MISSKSTDLSKSVQSIRINKLLSQAGYCSRREADKLIAQKRVSVNGKAVFIGQKVKPSDKVFVDSVSIKLSTTPRVYLAFNKPPGIVCTTNREQEKDNIIDFIKYPKRIFPIGRLDRESQGLILLTDDGQVVNKILRSQHGNQKEYLVRVNKSITDDFLEKMENGVPILNKVTQKCQIARVSKNAFKIILTQGLNRQIRRMCQHLGYRVKQLQRIRIMHIQLDVPVGRYRKLNQREVSLLLNPEKDLT